MRKLEALKVGGVQREEKRKKKELCVSWNFFIFYFFGYFFITHFPLHFKDDFLSLR
jgi:hypothetical protein